MTKTQTDAESATDIITDAGTDAVSDSGTRPQDPPVLVAATVGEVTAVWQVEVDARILLGDFSGAWLVDSEGIHGFAANADWIETRHSREQMLALLLHRPVIVVGRHGEALGAEEAGQSLGLTSDHITVVDVPATVAQAEQAISDNKEAFALANPGKRQPAWAGAWDGASFTPMIGRTPDGLSEDAAEAVSRALAGARGLRGLIRGWNALDKLRVQRLGGELRPLPLIIR